MATNKLSICVVTATTNKERARKCIESWGEIPTYVTFNGGDKPYAGSVPAFRAAVDQALAADQHWDLIACFHDDLEILDRHWADRVVSYFANNPAMGLAGFGGAVGLGDEDIYQTPYRPEQLARKGFRSNMVDAEVHGIRSLLSERVACLDGFSQIGRREFWEGRGAYHTWKNGEPVNGVTGANEQRRPWIYLEHLGCRHHAYDSHLGVIAARYGWETWYLPIACKHYGGSTAVGDPGYQEWAHTQVEGGDHGFWEQAHQLLYDDGRDILPLRV